mmetsp:Transcript_13314/g.14417  ORF Transcript_13314/g.14417 Transcript_13314/m.14417 type:complete len:125 (+) Transcript_13314:369-743(+)
MDFCLYRANPEICHSEICVKILEDSQEVWSNIATVTRLLPDVMKICIFALFDEKSGQFFYTSCRIRRKMCSQRPLSISQLQNRYSSSSTKKRRTEPSNHRRNSLRSVYLKPEMFGAKNKAITEN